MNEHVVPDADDAMRATELAAYVSPYHTTTGTTGLLTLALV